MDSRASTRARLSVLPVLIALFFNVALVTPIVPSLAGSTLALAGTNFDAGDGNMVDDDGAGLEVDWCTPSLTVAKRADARNGDDDNSYKSSAENDPVPGIDVDSIPPNKADFSNVYAASQTIGDDLFAYVAFTRFDTSGTTTLSFEFNQSGVLSANGVTFQRTQGDLLFDFDIQAGPQSTGGYDVVIDVRTWNGNATAGSWSSPTTLNSAIAEASVNEFDTISNCLDGGNLLAAQFGELAINLTDLLGGECRAFGSVLAKSRSSQPITSNLNDLVTPVAVDFSTCGQMTILKQDENQQALGGATFSITPNPFTLTGSLSVTDNQAPDDNAAAGTIHLSDVEPGAYTVCETAAPAGYIIDPTCEGLTLAANGSITFGPFINGLGDISWTKVDAQSGDKLCCATFSVVGQAGAAIGYSASVTDNGLNDSDPDVGELLLVGLKLGTYRITEVTPPSGYNLPSPAFQDVVLAGQTAPAATAFRDPPRADASIVKEAVVDPIVAGEDASFTVTVTAGGTGDSEDVVLTDLNETGHGWTITGADAGDCDDTSVADGETLSCDFGTVSNGETRTITITMNSDATDCAAGIANTASVSSSNDHDASNDTDGDSITVLCPNPGVAKVADGSPIVAGEDASFTITVNAGGTGPATTVVLSDLNDTGHDWVVAGTDVGACADTTVADGETLSCSWASIPSGQSRTVTITLVSDANDCAAGIENTATITADADVDLTNNSAWASIAVLCPDPSVAKTADVDPIVAGDPASFDIVVTAGGTGNAEGVALTDLNETDHAWAISGADAADCADLDIASGESLSCDFGTIPNGQERTVTITMTSDADDCADGIANTATITALADVDVTNNSDSASIEVLCPDLELDKTGSDPVSAGDKVRFTLTVTNHGEGTATDVVLVDALPGDGVGTWSVVDTEGIADSDCGIVADVLTCELAALAAGESFSVTVEAATSPDACPSIENDASVSATNEPASDEYPNDDSFAITVDCPDVAIDKEPMESPISAGENAEFSIAVWNHGDGMAYDVIVTDAAPEGTVWTVLFADGFACDDETVDGQQTLTCTLAELAPGEANARTILIGFKTSQVDCGPLDNAVTVSASNEDLADTEDNADDATIIVECPGLNILKTADADPIDARDEASFTITVWNAGPGHAFDVMLHDTLPAGLGWDFEVLQGDAGCDVASSIVDGGTEQMSIDCELGDLPPSEMEEGVIIRVYAETDREDCGTLENLAWADASNDDRVDADADIRVRCPEISLDKENDAVGPVLPGTTVTYTLALTVSDGPAQDVMVIDSLPIGLDNPTDISDGGVYDGVAHAITWDLGELADGTYTLTYEATVADDVANGAELVNAAAATSPNSQCPDLEALEPECEDGSTVIVRVPTLVIDKVADAEVITISGEADDLVATPSVVTWTLAWTLADGPVTNAVISDEIPDGFVFLDASDGGQLVDGVATWTFGTLSESGSVTFRTTVDPEKISRVAPTVNVAVIDSDETEPDEGQDSVTVVVDPPPLGGNPTPSPKPVLPDTATGFGVNGERVTIPVELLVAFFIGSLGAVALANVRARGRRR